VLENADGWWGEGDDMFFVDGERLPSINGTGTEDYFLGAWDFGGKPFSYGLFGAPVVGAERAGARWSALSLPPRFADHVYQVAERDHRARPRRRPRRQLLLGRLLVPDRTPRRLSRIAPGQGAAAKTASGGKVEGRCPRITKLSRLPFLRRCGQAVDSLSPKFKRFHVR